ncbi:Sec-independent protein translocase protein TatB [Tepidiforma thermophila]|uniref:Sec-independent protein translocase protein TatB n=1 Tax=Tepidiforma thermophila (strain KCTC 52669 / CGMCC 1.13589 / G233) TaxID=2761530 RepID=A0A2A9HGL2_TEPT2|nr:Sec-independent protein translocase protein TatB [Tepidiforma thermophila]PFG74230.1 sec-independent protein translocase protein TatB [Tepidiforma thermophila]
MEFLGIGYQELLLILVLLLVVVGPERLPQMAYQIGRAVRQMQLYARAVRDEFRDEIDYLDEQYRTMRGEIALAQQTLREEQAKLNEGLAEVDATLRAAEAEAGSALAAAPRPEPDGAGDPPAAAGPGGAASPPLVF